MLICKKVVTLSILLFLLSGSSFSQRIFYTEESTGKVRVGNLTGTSITGSVDFITGLFAPRTIEVDFSGGRLYVGDVGNGDIKAYLLSTGQLNSLVISRGAMAEFVDFEYSENAGGIFASGNGEVPGIFFIPEDNQDMGNEIEYNMGPYSSSTYHSVAVDDGNERVYGGSDDDQAIFRTGFASGTIEFPNLSAINPGPMNFNDLNNRLYYIREGVTSDIYSYNPTLNTSTLVRSLSPVNEIVEMQISGKLGKIFYSVLGDGIYSLNIDGSGSPVKILTASGSIYFDIEDEYTAPVFTALNPTNNATLVSTSPTLTMTFNENVQIDNTSIAGDPRTIRIYRENGAIDILYATIDRASANISITNNIVTISGVTGLLPGSTYYVLMGFYVFSDLSKNQFSGIVTPAGWTFQTVPPVVITAPAQPACVAAFTDLPNIIITESVNGNIKTGANQTLIFTPSAAGYSFEAGTGTVSFTAGRNITTATISVLSNSITVTYTATAETFLDALTISGIKVRAASISSPAVNLIRSGGTGTIEGLSTNTVVASFTPQPVPAAPAITYSSGNNLCIGSDVSGIVISTTGTSLKWYDDSGLTSERTSIAGSGALSGPDIGLSSASANTVTLYVNQTINGCTSPTATAAMTIIDGPTSILTSKTDQTSCASPNGSITVTGVGGGGTTGYTYEWADASLNPLGVTTTTLSNRAAGIYNLRVTSDATGCSNYASPITIADNVIIPFVIFGIAANTSCVSNNGSLTANIQNQVGLISDYTFTWRNGSSPTSPINSSSTSNVLSNLSAGPYGLTIRHVPSQCEAFYTENVLNIPILPSYTAPSIVACETTAGGGTANIDLTTYNNIITGGDANLTVSWFSSGTPVTTVTASNGSSYEYRVIHLSTGCESIDLTSVTVTGQPTATAGPDQTICGTAVTLAGNTPVNGTGNWTITSGTGGSFATATSPTSSFTGVAGNTYVLRWTVTNGSCTASSDEVSINLVAPPTVANTGGADQFGCSGVTFTLNGNTPTVGTGLWTIASGPAGTINTPTSPTTTFSGPSGNYVLQWTITNGICPSSSATTNINIFQPPTTSNAGPDQSTCGTTVTLNANTPTVGTGEWSVVSGAGGSFTDDLSPASVFNGVTGSTYTLRWSITPGLCPPSTDEVVISFITAPTAPNAGPDQSVCTTTATLAATAPGTGVGAWTIVSGTGGTITTPSSNTSAFTGTIGSTYVLRWTVTNAGCTPVFDDVSITILNAPTASNAGVDQSTCGTTATLSANTPTVGTGAWSVISGAGGSFVTPSSPTSSFNGVAGVSYTLRWTISNGSCTPSTDDVAISLLAAPTAANAGSDQTVCTTATLGANVPAIGTGAWTIVSGVGGTVTNTASNTSTFTGTAGNTYVLRWTITIGSCTPSTDDVTITFLDTPTISNAGPDQGICGTTATLSANTPTVGSGLWTIVSGTGGFTTTPTDPASAFNGVAGATYILRWTITNGSCTPSNDEVTITFLTSPTASIAGTDQSVCATITTLAGNTPSTGTGTWTIVSGTGGIITDNSSGTSTFSGTAGSTYVLRWTIINGSCTPSSDDVSITFISPPTQANAGTDQANCGATATLQGNTPVIGTGLWSIVSGTGGTIATATNPTSSFTGTAGNSYTLRWTTSNSTCPVSSDDVIIQFVSAPSVASAGTDRQICGTTLALDANVPTSGTGAWSVVSGAGGSVANNGSATSSFTGLAGGNYTLRWTISNGSCPVSTDEVVVTFVAPPTIANAGIDQIACTTTTTLAANTPVIGTGSWSVISGAGGSFANNTSNTSTFTGVAGTTYVLRWSVTNGICTTSTDDVSVSFVSPPTAASAGADQTVCNTTVALAGNTPASGSGTWSVISGTGGGFSSPSSPNSNFVGTAGNTYTLRWTISRTGCTSTSDDVTIQINSLPAGNGIISNVSSVCEGQSKTLTVSGFTNATGYSWQVPTGVNIESENGASITITTAGSGGTVSVTPTNSCGNGTTASAVLTILPLPVVQINLPASPLPADPVIFSYSTSSSVQSQEWSFGDNSSSAEPSPQYAYLTGGEYQVSLSVTDNNGCIGITNVPFRVLAEPDLNDNSIKNVITANGDEKNRYLHILDLDRHPQNEVRFLDRWGVEVFRADNYQNNWDARSMNGQFLPAGQYICVVRLKESGKVFSRTVSIIKGR